jgi:cysteine-rich repeat protein
MNMKKLCLSGIAPRFGALALLVGASGLATTAGCAKQTSAGAGGDSATTSSAGGGGTGTNTATATSSGGGLGGSGGATSSSSSTGGAGGAGGATSSSSGTGGQGGMPFVPPPGTADYPAETEQNDFKSSANLLQMGTKGFTASLWPLGDVDVFSIQVTVPNSQLDVSTGDGLGGCPPGALTLLRVFNESGAVIASDKDSGPGSCSLLLSASTPALQALAVGTYYLQVENLLLTPLSFYVLDVKLTPPMCGDGVIQLSANEQCDDKNLTSGDGCSPTCQLEGLYGKETETNDTLANANPLGGLDGVIGAIGTLADQDYFSFDVTVAGSSVTLTVDNGLGQCPAGFDSKLYLYNGAGAELTSDDDSGPGGCSTISPTLYPAAGGLPAGTYFARVEALNNAGVAPYYVFTAKIKPPACGDGVLQIGEQCDDNNLTAGDGCSATCAFEGNFVPETEPNDTQALANPLGSADGLLGSISPIGDQDYFSFDVITPGSSVFMEVTDGLNGCPAGFDSKLTLFNPSGASIATVDDGGKAKCSLLSPITTPTASNMAVGKYKVRLEYTGNTTAIPSYVLKIKVVPPSCGDSVLQPGEQCDDSNAIAGDGCSATCQSEPPYEIEPNGTRATATPQWPGFSTWIGAITPLGDHDFYIFTLAASSTVTLTTHAVNDATSCPGDTLLHLTNSTGTELMNNDDAPVGAGVKPCSSLTKLLPAGTYYTWVQRYLDSTLISAYQLDLTVQ